MHRRYEHANIPIEILRTLVTISDSGTFAKVAEQLKLSQPAITAQIKRLQIMVGGPIFERELGALVFTDLGRLVLEHARRILIANDQILLLGGGADRQPVRLGLSTLYAEALFSIWPRQNKHPRPHIHCDYSKELLKRIAQGQLDLVCCIENNPSDTPYETVESWDEPFVWVRRQDFFIPHDEPIPIVAPSGVLPEHPMIRALEGANKSYQIVFSSPDHHARMAAVSAGIGLFAIPKRFMPASLIIAPDITLPPLPSTSGTIYRRRDLADTESRWILNCLKTLRPKKELKLAQ